MPLKFIYANKMRKRNARERDRERWDAIVEDTHRDKVWWGFFAPTLTKLAYRCFFIVNCVWLDFGCMWLCVLCRCMTSHIHITTHIAKSSNFPAYNARLIFYLWKCNVSISILVAWALEQLFTIYRIFAFRMDATPHTHSVALSPALSISIYRFTEMCGIFA